MERWYGQVAVVTGATSLLGMSISKALVEKGLKVIGLARRVDRLEELAKHLSDQQGKLYPHRCDISREEDLLRTFKWVKEHVGPVHVLINNASLSRPTNLSDGSTDDWRRVYEVNVLGLCMCTREAIRSMREADVSGHIVHINSISGHYVTPMPESSMNVFPSSKFAVTALTETLRQELRQLKSKIKITSVSPSVIKSEPADCADATETEPKKTRAPSLRPEDVADAVVYVLSTPPHVQVQELLMRSVGEKY